MTNVFHTIKSNLDTMPGAAEDRASMWQFILVLPYDDLVMVSLVCQEKKWDILKTYRDEHPIWQAVEMTLPEWQANPTMDFAENQYRFARALYTFTAGAEIRNAALWREWMEGYTVGTVRFKADINAAEFYERIYTHLIWQYLPSTTSAELEFVLSGYYLVKSYRMCLDVASMLQNYLNATEILPEVRQNITKEWLGFVEKNDTVLPMTGSKPARSVAAWLALAKKKVPAQPNEADIKKFFDAYEESAELLESDRDMLAQIIVLYATLKRGAWDNHPDVIKEFSEDVYDFLKHETHHDARALQAIEEPFRAWFVKQPGLRGRQLLVLSLIGRIRIEDHLESLSIINDWCNILDTAHKDMDLFYYDEAGQEFLWNENLIDKDPTIYQIQAPIRRRDRVYS